ncbi:MAG: alpha-amylase family glycosyl hydrolase [Opitutales bacterium]|nr:alpha-amylase family glycosyl hydrolase [Opitutales bacterium]
METINNGLVFLEKDWDGGPLPEDLVEESGMIGSMFSIVESEKSARLGGYVKNEGEVHFLINKNDYPFLTLDSKRIFLATDFNGWTKAIGNPQWELLPKKSTENIIQLSIDWKVALELKTFSFKFVTEDKVWLEPNVPVSRSEINELGSRNFIFDPNRTGRDIVCFELMEGPRKEKLDRWLNVVPNGKFGYKQTLEGSSFRVFAPRAVKMELLLYKKEEIERHLMSLNQDGSWSITLSDNCEGLPYKYAVHHVIRKGESMLFEKEVVDPYARAMDGRNGPGLALTVQPSEKKHHFHTPKKQDLIILETHIRDLLTNAPIPLSEKERMEFRGLSKWLQSEDCYLRKLGVNAIEIQPIHEFDARTKEEYHWGYMSVNFFAPSSSYASNGKDGSAVHEFKSLVDRFHEAELAVIIDVVYNHVGVPSHLSFLDRELYFSTDENGNLNNHSGCGNDIHAESGAVRKLVIDSLISMINDFDIDGFRFDLGELLGINLLSEIEIELLKVKPDIILIAEPWSFRGRLPEEINQTGYSLWSDNCREKLLNFVRGNGKQCEIIDLLKGRLDQQNTHPWQSINYLESHDDLTFVDRLCSPDEWENAKPPSQVIAQAKLAIGLLLLSPGIPMIASGQDYLRSKNGVQNTYQRGDLNALKYNLFKETQDFHNWTKELISLRSSKEGELFRPYHFMAEDRYISVKGPHDTIAQIIFAESDIEIPYCLLILINPSGYETNIPLPEICYGKKETILLGESDSQLGTIQPLCLQVWKIIL